MKHRLAGPAAIAALTLLLAACGDEEDSGIASLQNATAQPTQGTDMTAEEQALAFAQCMRDNGVDFPDPTVDSDGNPSFEGAFQRGQDGGFEPGDTSFRDAIDACGDLMDGLTFGGPGGGGQFDPSAIEDSLYEYTQCLRDEGLDVGDITFGGGPQGGDDAAAGGTTDGEPPAGAPDRGQAGPGGDPTDRFADQLGQDPDDPAWIAANEVCQPLIEAAFNQNGGTDQ